MTRILGDECHQDAAYSVNPLTDSSGKIYDYQCTNRENSCRWRICQCDRAFAHKIKAEVRNRGVLCRKHDSTALLGLLEGMKIRDVRVRSILIFNEWFFLIPFSQFPTKIDISLNLNFSHVTYVYIKSSFFLRLNYSWLMTHNFNQFGLILICIRSYKIIRLFGNWTVIWPTADDLFDINGCCRYGPSRLNP